MQTVQILLISVSLAMDAFSVSLCKGLKMKKFDFNKSLIIGLFFGGFQMAMPIIGYFLGSTFVGYIEQFDHYIAFGILSFLGVKMIIESIRDKEEETSADIKIKELLVLSVATSIDALAVGITFSFDGSMNIFISSAIIGIVTFALCVVGVFIGHKSGSKFKKSAGITGGAILVILGIKILLEGIGVLPL